MTSTRPAMLPSLYSAFTGYVCRGDQLLRVHQIAPPEPVRETCGREYEDVSLCARGEVCGRTAPEDDHYYHRVSRIETCKRATLHRSACSAAGDPPPAPRTVCGIALHRDVFWIEFKDEPRPGEGCSGCALGTTARRVTPVYALSIHQPWAWAILYAGKDVENRSWWPRHGLIAIHATRTIDPVGFDVITSSGHLPPPAEALPTGAVVGVVNVTGARRDSPSQWAADGQVHWQLENPVPLVTPIPCRGRQRLWRLGIFADLVADQMP